jgi:hypothetical protein
VFCTQCGKQLVGEGAAYCAHCGARVLSSAEAAGELPGAPVADRAGSTGGAAVQRRTESMRRVVLGTGAGCALVLLVGSVVLAVLASRLAEQAVAAQTPEPPAHPYRNITEALADNPTIRMEPAIVHLPGPIVGFGAICALVVVLITLAIARRFEGRAVGDRGGDGRQPSG